MITTWINLTNFSLNLWEDNLKTKRLAYSYGQNKPSAMWEQWRDTCGVYGNTVNDRLTTQGSILRKTSYKRPSPNKHPVKTGRQFELTEKKGFCDQFWKKFCDFYENFSWLTFIHLISRTAGMLLILAQITDSQLSEVLCPSSQHIRTSYWIIDYYFETSNWNTQPICWNTRAISHSLSILFHNMQLLRE